MRLNNLTGAGFHQLLPIAGATKTLRRFQVYLLRWPSPRNCSNKEVSSTMRIAVIGGGIAGLAAAYELEQARASGAAVEYALFEARERLGGVLSSEIVTEWCWSGGRIRF
jgi:heterodisulfide reductase subunit A-like polyferredoxin